MEIAAPRSGDRRAARRGHTGIFTIAGISVGVVLTAAGNWIAALHSGQAGAHDLFAEVVKAVSALEIEKASFRESRDFWPRRASGATERLAQK
jgi:hypothetical protein